MSILAVILTTAFFGSVLAGMAWAGKGLKDMDDEARRGR